MQTNNETSWQVIPGNTVQQILLDSVKTGRVSHAYLFDGPENSEKLNTALKFSKALLCQSQNSCGKCLSCKMFENNSHPDHHFLSVNGDTIKIREHIEPFFSDILLSSPYSNKKLYIINEAHKMNAASQNSILKTLEEPNPNIVIILLTENIDLLLSTILSRVIRYSFSSRDILDPDDDTTDSFLSIMKNIASPAAEDRIQASNELANQKSNYNDLLDMIQFYYRNSLVAKYTRNEMLINLPITDKITPTGAIEAIKIIDDIRFAVKSNANIQLVSDVLVTKLYDIHNL